MTTRSATAGLLLALLLLPLPRAAAHDMAAKRRLLVAVEASQLTLLVALELADGPDAARLSAAWNLDADRANLSPAERLAQAQLLLPRLRHGWTLELENRPVTGTLGAFVVTPHPGQSPERGFTVAATWVVPVADAPLHLALYTLAETAPVEAEVQVQEPWFVRLTELPRDANAWLVGPFTLDSDAPSWVELDRRDQLPATDARPAQAAPQSPPAPAAATPPKR
jgi:hypothetical protein